MSKKEEKPERKKLIRRLRNHYKLVILNIDTFEERFSLMLTPLNVIVVGGIGFSAIAFAAFTILGWTPLRYYLPDYAEDVRVKKLAVQAMVKADSMELALAQRNAFMENFRNVMEGNINPVNPDTNPEVNIEIPHAAFQRSKEDSMLRVEIEKEDLVNLNPNFNKDKKSSYLLFPPIHGTITERFKPQRDHFGVDIAAPKNEPIKAIEDGTVIIAAYSSETGYIIQIQHGNDLLSVYKHNSVLLKKQGEKVRAGEAIAIIGETGEFSSGPHLHFEMWRNGVAINPESFFSFD